MANHIILSEIEILSLHNNHEKNNKKNEKIEKNLQNENENEKKIEKKGGIKPGGTKKFNFIGN
jgi:hypothetical protein